MTQYFFHSSNGERTVDRVGTEFKTEAAARAELIRRAGLWIAAEPSILIENSECRIEMTLKDLKPIFSIMMFTTDPRSFGKGR